MNARNIGEVIPAFLLPESRRAYKDRTYIQGRKEGEKLLKKVKWLDQDCNKCGRQLNSWDARLSKTLAYKYPCCESCIAAEYDMSAERLRDRMENYFGMRPCQGL